MEDKYYKKYLKYKSKYLMLRNQRGGNLERMKPLFDRAFGDKWVLTGSEAVRQYLIFFNRLDLLKFTPKDLDIIYVTNPITFNETYIGDYKRRQTTTNDSMTYTRDTSSFDLFVWPGVNYYEINNLKLYPAKKLLKDYEDNFSTSNKKEADKEKMKALKVIIELIDQLNLEQKTLSIREKRREISPIVKRRGLFDDNEKNEQPDKKYKDDSFNSPPRSNKLSGLFNSVSSSPEPKKLNFFDF